MAHIRSILIKKYPDLNVSFIEMLTEEFFNSHFVEDAEQIKNQQVKKKEQDLKYIIISPVLFIS